MGMRQYIGIRWNKYDVEYEVMPSESGNKMMHY